MSVYLDNAATAPMPEAVLAAYTEAAKLCGNAASLHRDGQHARKLLEQAREDLAEVVGCQPLEVVFTSGGTESSNMAIKGFYWAQNSQGHSRKSMISSPIEHKATSACLLWLERTQGAFLHYVDADEHGLLSYDDWQNAALEYSGKAALATFLWAHNEIGVIQPAKELIASMEEQKIGVYVDGVCALGALPINFQSLGCAAMGFSAHKIGGPLGIGALIVRRFEPIVPLTHGGEQELGRRSGTVNVPGAVAFSVAAQLAERERVASAKRECELSKRLVEGILGQIPNAQLTGPELGCENRLASNVHVRFPDVLSDVMLFLLDEKNICVSSGSACHAGITQPSAVLGAIGLEGDAGNGAIRFTFGKNTSVEDIDYVLHVLSDVYSKARTK